MKLGELIVELGTKGNTKELEKTLKQLKEAEKRTAAQIKLNKDLAKATSDEEKALIKHNYAQKQEIVATEKLINKNKERNKTIIEGIKGFTRLIGTISLAIGILDRFANASAKTNQNILTLSQTSGVDVNTINKYASAARSLNYNASREDVAQSFQAIAQQLIQLRKGEEAGLIEGINTLKQYGSKGDLNQLISVKTNPEKFIEVLREYIKGVDDIYVAQALSQMGISTNLLPMLRMSPEAFASVRNRFPSKEKMEEEQRKSIEAQEKRDELGRTWQELLVDLYPLLNDLLKEFTKLLPILIKIAPSFVQLLEKIIPLLDKLVPVIDKLIEVLIELLDRLNQQLENKKPKKIIKHTINASTPLPVEYLYNGILKDIKEEYFRKTFKNNSQINVNNNFNNTIHTTQPGDAITLSENLQQGQMGLKEVQILANQGATK